MELRSPECAPANISTKLTNIAKAIGWGVEKDKKNDFHKYYYTSAAGLKAKIGPLLAANGITPSTSVEVITSTFKEKSSYVVAKVSVCFTCNDKGTQIFSEGLGAGYDKGGDKAAMKAFTAAEKYAYIGAFCLAMGEDPELDQMSSGKESGNGYLEHYENHKQAKISALLSARKGDLEDAQANEILGIGQSPDPAAYQKLNNSLGLLGANASRQSLSAWKDRNRDEVNSLDKVKQVYIKKTIKRCFISEF